MSSRIAQARHIAEALLISVERMEDRGMVGCRLLDHGRRVQVAVGLAEAINAGWVTSVKEGAFELMQEAHLALLEALTYRLAEDAGLTEMKARNEEAKLAAVTRPGFLGGIYPSIPFDPAGAARAAATPRIPRIDQQTGRVIAEPPARPVTVDVDGVHHALYIHEIDRDPRPVLVGEILTDVDEDMFKVASGGDAGAYSGDLYIVGQWVADRDEEPAGPSVNRHPATFPFVSWVAENA